MLGATSKIMTKSDELAAVLFGKGEHSDRVAQNALKMIVGDMRAIFQEYVKAEGRGALFYNTINEDFSTFMKLEDIRGDKELAHNNNDSDLEEFLQKLENVVNDEDEFEKAIIVLLTQDGMSLHLLDIDEASEKIDAASAK